MPKKEVPVNQLAHYLPEGTLNPVLAYLHRYKVHLTVAQERKTILGDYRHRTHYENHRISVNGNLNKFSFLVTLIHEIAHLLTYEQFGNKVAAHGNEWKRVYGSLLEQFLQNKVFPADIEHELKATLRNPAASSCAEDGLVRVMRRYDEKESPRRLVEEIPQHALFRAPDGRIFKKGEKLRKRFKCVEVATGKIFLFSPVYEVILHA